MQITIHRGTHEIGGNCIEIVSGTSRIILDIGMPLFDSDREPYDTANLRRLKTEELRQQGILPSVMGVFDSGPLPDGILISHAHEDHTGLIRHANEKIPIYASTGTSKMMYAGFKFAGQPLLPPQRHRSLIANVPVQIGNFQITPYAVDHSIFGAQAFLIEAGGKTVLYSGDLRMHGRKPGMHRHLIDALKERSIDVLLMEGTHIGHPDYHPQTEYEIDDEIVEQIKSSAGLVLASFSPQHVDRLVGFYRAAVRTGRTFVIDAYTAFVMHLIASEISIPRPESTENIRVYFPKYFLESCKRKKLFSFYELMVDAGITINEIRSRPANYVMIFRPSMLEPDFDGKLPEASRCLFSRWTGYLEQPEWQTVKSELDRSHGDLSEVHTSGHISASDIARFVKQINARMIVPVHTFEPERFLDFFPNSQILDNGLPFFVR